ncbi:PKD domain-containing protein [Actinokineospora alba]|uniref:PKD domain-containing protein n=1 Tax=Actinokineospora alba TaxID=504798 RepID=A0A1H0V889_9PSEU|nr:PKD domain-containing protein [Actinokineospora alba]TDP65535.1 PKD domain-containing protein [Actinokineospora alba]SDH64778.1 PKD domain-containing protein [Actinokineospora alba]SDP74660.1 PKD domain-containing protein [Actinokineospora alba]
MTSFTRRGLVVVCALSLAAGPLAVRPALAEPSVLHVSDKSACSDTGAGTVEQPFCTVQAAADIVTAGQTVKIEGDHRETVTITRSGTETAPIVFEGDATVRRAEGDTVPTITVREAHDVVLRRMRVAGAVGIPAVHVAGASRVTVDRLTTWGQFEGSPGSDGMRVDGGSSAVTLSRNSIWGYGKRIVVDGASHVTITGNELPSRAPHRGVTLNNAPGTAFTGNTVRGSCNKAVSVTGDAAGTSIQNNIISHLTSASSSSLCESGYTYPLAVDAAAAPGVTVDYNIVHTSSNRVYLWAGTTYASPAELTAATGQGGHDYNVDPDTVTAWVDSANADAPGQLADDIDGHPRVDNPHVADLGGGAVTYHDRGARETQDQLDGHLSFSATRAPVGGEVKVVSTLTSRWGLPVTCDIDFGDGSKLDDAPCETPHAYSATGTYQISVTASTASKLTYALPWRIEVVAAGGALTPSVTATQNGVMSANFQADGGTSPWNVVSVVWDYGDGVTENQSSDRGWHSYRTPGTYTVRATVTDAGGRTAVTSTVFATRGSGIVPFGPTRVLDTRTGVGQGGAVRKIDPFKSIRLAVGGQAGIPVGVTAVAVNVAVTNPTQPGHITGYPAGEARPLASIVNFRAGQTVSNLVILPVSAGGAIDFHNGSSGTVDLVGDVAGYFVRERSEGYAPMDASRVLDTRQGTGTPTGAPAQLPAGQTWSRRIVGGNVPTSATAVVLNVTAAGPAGSGHLTVFPTGKAKPLASNLNYVAGQILTNAVVVPVGVNGEISYFTTTTTHLVVDIVGYVGGDTYFVPVTPVRKVDTRMGTGQGAPKPLDPRVSTYFPVLEGVSPPGTFVPDAAVMNVTVVNPRTSGYLTAHAPQAPWSATSTSTLNFTPGGIVSNLAVVGSGTVAFHNGSDATTDLVVDVTGYFGRY